MTRGQGANVEPKRGTLTTDEYNIMSELLIHPEVKYTEWHVAHQMKRNIRTVAASLSNLVGMDLVKSTGMRFDYLTDAEKITKLGAKKTVYWISGIGSPWYQRSLHVFERNGKLDALKDLTFGLDLFPSKSNKKYRYEGELCMVWQQLARDYQMDEQVKITVEVVNGAG